MMKPGSIQSLIERATSETLIHPDPVLFQACIDQVNSRPDMYIPRRPKEAIKVIKKRIASRNPKVQLLTLELLNRAVDSCGLPLHTQVASKDTIIILSSLVKNRETDGEVKEKLVSLVQKWGAKFQDSQDILPGFSELFNSLRQAGVSFSGNTQVSAPSQPVQLPTRGIAQPPSPQAQNSRKLPTQKLEKLKSDLGVVRENITLTNEMIDASEPGPAVAQNEVLLELTNTLRAMQGKLTKLIESVSDEDLLAVSLSVKEELDVALGRYQELREGRKPVKIGAQKSPPRRAEPVPSFLDMDPEPIRPQPVEKPQPQASSIPFDIFGGPPSISTNSAPETRTQAPVLFTSAQIPGFSNVQNPSPPVVQKPVVLQQSPMQPGFYPPQGMYVGPQVPQQTYVSQPQMAYGQYGFGPGVQGYAPSVPQQTYPVPSQQTYPVPSQQTYPVPSQPRIKHNMSSATEEVKKSESDSKPKDLFDDLVQL